MNIFRIKNVEVRFRASLLRIKAIIIKELRQLSRDRITFGMVVMLPLLQLLLFGYAINTDVRNIPIAVVDQSHSRAGRIIVGSVKATQVVTVVEYFSSVAQAEQAIMQGEVRGVLVLPADLMQRIAQHRTLGQWIVDGSDTMLSAALIQLKNMPLQELNTYLPMQTAASSPPHFEVTLLFNPERVTVVNTVPGLLGVILTMTMTMFTSAAIVRERERGNLELLITTPVHPLELMLAKIIPYIFIGLIQMSIILGLGNLIFDVPINGSLLDILFGSLLFIAASLSLGLVISSIAQTQLQSMQMTVFILLPSILLSGFLFPYEAMPVATQWIAEVFPATHFMRLIRGIVIRGSTLADLWQDALWLFVFSFIGLLVASLRFKKSLD